MPVYCLGNTDPGDGGLMLSLGCCDQGSVSDPKEYLSKFHEWQLPAPKFRGEKSGEWIDFQNVTGTSVRAAQEQLRELGFFPHGAIDGVYGYRTQSAVRLFQEYVCTVEDRADIGDVDGVLGDITRSHLDRWVEAGMRPAWGPPSPDYTAAMAGLTQLKQYFSSSGLDEEIRLLNDHAAGTSSLPVEAWRYAEDDIHLVGVRRNVEGTTKRGNDDLFVLLVHGMRMVFRGSTDPTPEKAKRSDAAFLLRGQHRYRFGWHKVAEMAKHPLDPAQVYRAFKPKDPAGPLVVRTIADRLTDKSFQKAEANPGINIHWSGSGTSNWSAGCQVVAGLKYIDFTNALRDLSGRAAVAYGDLGSKKTRGAYNVLVDMLTVFATDAGPGGDTLYYTLLYERDVHHTEAGALVDFPATIKRLS